MRTVATTGLNQPSIGKDVHFRSVVQVLAVGVTGPIPFLVPSLACPPCVLTKHDRAENHSDDQRQLEHAVGHDRRETGDKDDGGALFIIRDPV